MVLRGASPNPGWKSCAQHRRLHPAADRGAATDPCGGRVAEARHRQGRSARPGHLVGPRWGASVSENDLPPHHHEFAVPHCGCYGRAPTPLRLLSLSENATYLVDDDDPMVLGAPAGYNDGDAIRSELAWMSGCAAKPRSAHHLIETTDGDAVQPVAVAGRVPHVDAVTFIPGCTAEEKTGGRRVRRARDDHRRDARPRRTLGDLRISRGSGGPGDDPEPAGPLGRLAGGTESDRCRRRRDRPCRRRDHPPAV